MDLKRLENYVRLITGEEYLTRTQLQQKQKQRMRKEAQQQRRRREAQQQRQMVYNELTEIGITETDFQNNNSKFFPTTGKLSTEQIQNLINWIERHYPEKDNIINSLKSLKNRTVVDDMKKNLTKTERNYLFKNKNPRRI